ncbi:MAG: hypothetical protein NZ108_01895, partial [Bacteroidia bacterium]|nr:hypothetical protein [Bacteroidia bacterium]
MKKILFVLICLAFLFLTNFCQRLEQESVSVGIGLRIDEFIPLELAKEQIHSIQEKGFQTILLELPIQADSQTYLPKINRTALVQLSRFLTFPEIQSKQIELQVMLTRINHDQIFPNGKPDSLTIWQTFFWNEIQLLLNRIENQ